MGDYDRMAPLMVFLGNIKSALNAEFDDPRALPRHKLTTSIKLFLPSYYFRAVQWY